MRQDLTDITLVVDRSGSMNGCLTDAQGGINQFINEQKTAPGEALLTLVQFDDHYEFVHQGKPVKEVGEYRLVPRGWTALLDAVGRAMAETGERLSRMPEAERPACVVFVIVTDGQENKSKEYTLEQVREAIKLQRETYHWVFMFLGADDSAFGQAKDMGLGFAQAAVYDKAVAGQAYRATSKKVSAIRGATLDCAEPEDVVKLAGFTDEEREALKS